MFGAGDGLFDSQAYNVGVACGADGAGAYLAALDLDEKGGKSGSASLRALMTRVGLKVLPKTYTQHTPSGGAHLLFRTPFPVKNSAGKLGEGIDVRGQNGFVVAAGSELETGVYSIALDVPVNDLPEELLELLEPYQAASEGPVVPLGLIDESAAVQRAREYLSFAQPAVEGQGGNAHSFTVAARCKDLGLNADTTLALMLEEGGWNSKCCPPWEAYELERIVSNAFEYGRNPPGCAAPEAAFTAATTHAADRSTVETDYSQACPSTSDLGLAISYEAAAKGTRRFCDPTNTWSVFVDGRFITDATNRVRLEIAEHNLAEAHRIMLNASGSDPKELMKAARTANTLCSTAKVGAVEKMARTRPGIAIAPDSFDKDDFILGVPGGVVDLRTASFRLGVPEDLVSKRAGAAPSGDCPRFKAFVVEMAGGDESIVAYLQRLCGYLMTGSMREHIIVFLYGPGGNGKGVFTSVIEAALKDYARPIPKNAFLLTNKQEHSTDIAGLAGVRACIGSEWPDGGKMNLALVKSWSGGDRQTARLVNENNFDFKPQGKLVFVGNSRPTLSVVDPAIERRMHLIPCLHKPATVNPMLYEELIAELPGIVAWMIQGCAEWLRVGLDRPESISKATESYLESEDHFGQWLADRVEMDHDGFISTKDALSDIRSYAANNGFSVGESKWLADAMERKGYKPSRGKGIHRGQRGYVGVRLIQDQAVCEPKTAASLFGLVAANSNLAGAL